LPNEQFKRAFLVTEQELINRLEQIPQTFMKEEIADIYTDKTNIQITSNKL